MSERAKTLVEEIRRFNRWRRGDESEEMPDPKLIGEALDELCDVVEKSTVGEAAPVQR